MVYRISLQFHISVRSSPANPVSISLEALVVAGSLSRDIAQLALFYL